MNNKKQTPPDNQVHITVFGLLNITNGLGTVQETQHKQGLSWLLLKYMLTNRGRAIEMSELLGSIWPEKQGVDAENAARVRLRRIREALAPIGLGGVHGFILFKDGQYFFNPDYEILSDADDFTDLMIQLHYLPADNPVGLKLCSDALSLIQGPYLERTPDGPWIDPYRKYYHQEFCKLCHETISRTRTLGIDDAIPLLCQKSSVMAPNEAELHKEIISYLMEQKKELDLVRHVTTLARKGGNNAQWLTELL